MTNATRRINEKKDTVLIKDQTNKNKHASAIMSISNGSRRFHHHPPQMSPLYFTIVRSVIKTEKLTIFADGREYRRFRFTLS